MVFYSFYTDKFRSPDSLVYRTEDGYSPLQINLKMFESHQAAERDFFGMLYDNEDLRIGEYFDTDKGKKKKSDKPQEKRPDDAPAVYDIVPSDFKLELNKVYNLDCLLFMKELPNKYLDYIFTSPPYNIKKQIGTDNLYKVYGDDLTPEEYFDWLSSIIDEGMRVTKKHFFMNIQMLGKNKHTVLGILGKYKHIIKDIVIWKKSIVAPHIQEGIMNSAFEFIIIFSNDRPELKKFSDANWRQGTFNNVIEGINASQNKHRNLNKATFPLYLPRVFMQNFGKKLDIWYDPFNGTGTTGQAAALEERYYLGTEIDIEQVVVTQERVEEENSKLKLDFGEGFADESIGLTEESDEISEKEFNALAKPKAVVPKPPELF
jgi:DNA modification methylase